MGQQELICPGFREVWNTSFAQLPPRKSLSRLRPALQQEYRRSFSLSLAGGRGIVSVEKEGKGGCVENFALKFHAK
jgi:hypothetical protein